MTRNTRSMRQTILDGRAPCDVWLSSDEVVGQDGSQGSRKFEPLACFLFVVFGFIMDKEAY